MVLRRFLSNVTSGHANQLLTKSLPKRLPIAGVNKTILISSTKGGVGKSTVAVNLAIALGKIDTSKAIGLMDSDIFGPSIPQMMGLVGMEPDINEKKLIIPLQNYGIKCMSIGSLVKKDSAILWRGLMVMQAVQTLLRQVAWGPLDTLVIDMPPGTGDVQLSLSQNIPIQGAVIVTTSQSLALSDTQRGMEMFLKLNVPLIGIVENMSHFVCPCCNAKSSLWHAVGSSSDSGCAKLADQYKIPMLAHIPLEPQVSVGSEQGQPVVLTHPESITSSIFMGLAHRVKVLIDKS